MAGAGWTRSFGGFLRRTLQAADENNLPFLASALTFGAILALAPFVALLLVVLTTVLQMVGGAGVDPGTLFQAFLPPHLEGGSDPFEAIGALLRRIDEHRGTISLVALPAFLWFSTRLFAGVRTALNEIYDVADRPSPRRHFLVSLLLAKARDIAMVVIVIVLFLTNVGISVGIKVLLERGGARAPEMGFLFSTLGRWSAEALALGFAVTLFYLVYRHAAARQVRRVPALVGSLLAAVLFELAKRLFGLYLSEVAASERFSFDANIGAITLFVLWVYYTAIVFLLGGVVAQIWELRARTERQRAHFA